MNQVLSTVGTFFLPLSVTTDGHFSTEIMWTSYRATMGTEGHPNVIGIGSYVLVPLFALAMGLWPPARSRSTRPCADGVMR